MQERARRLNSAPVRGGDYVLYWCQMNRRAECNQALDFALELANQLRVPVLYLRRADLQLPVCERSVPHVRP